MKKILTLFFCSSLFLCSVAAQDANVDEIKLPDLTTVISGEILTAGKESVPDYSLVLPENDSPQVQLPVMGKIKKTDADFSEEEKKVQLREKDIYAQGSIGAGYPFYFSGDFSVYRASGESPFAVNFAHESAEGFAGKDADKGFLFRNTSVNAKKSFYNSSGKHELEAVYKTADNGLQYRSERISNSVNHFIGGKFDSEWELPKNFGIFYGFNGNWYTRYGEKSNKNFWQRYYESIAGLCNANPTYGVEEHTTVSFLKPYLGAKWNYNGIGVNFTADYAFQGNLKASDNMEKAKGASSANASHRAEFKLGFDWKINDEMFDIFADASVVTGTMLGDPRVIFPFKAGVKFQNDLFEDANPAWFEICGGLNSYQASVSELETKYNFAYSPSLPTETSDWFGKLDVFVPVKSLFEFFGGVEFKKTIFDNGEWMPDYKKSNRKSDLYRIASTDRMEFNSELGMNFKYSFFQFGAEWKAYWNDIPPLVDEHNLTASVLLQSGDAKYSVGTSSRFGFGSGADECPDVKFWSGIRLASSLSLALEVNDIVKLVTQSTRSYAHSDYITKSGNVALFVKFQF